MEIVKLSLACLSVALIATGCSSSSKKDDAFAEHCEYRPGIQAPEWYCNPETAAAGGLAAVGEAKANAGNDSNFQRTEALANGRDELARQLEIKVKNAFKNFTSTTGVGDQSTYDKSTENVSRQVVNTSLTGSKQLKRWMAPDGTLVLLVGVADKNPVVDSIKSSFRNEKALWQKFQADKAQEQLDQYIEQEFSH